MSKRAQLGVVAGSLALGGAALLYYWSSKGPGKKGSSAEAGQVTSVPDIEDLDPCECGFDRPKDGPLVEIHGSVKPLAYHFLVSTPVPPVKWPSEAEEINPVMKAICGIKFPKGQTMSCQVYYDPESSADVHTVLWYPNRVAFSGVTAATAPALIDCAQKGSIDTLPAGVTGAPITKTNVFICAHRGRDKRCGYCGPVLFAEFTKDLKIRHLLNDSVDLHKVSHVGGHKYAGNVLIYGPTLLDWYSYVHPSDVRELINVAIVREEWVPRLWRGRVGIDAAENAKMVQHCREVNAGK